MTMTISIASKRTESTHPKLRSQIIRIRFIHLLPACEDMLELFVVRLMDTFFERLVPFKLVGFEGGEVLRYFLVTVTW
jgi:hypothetical protein